MRATESIKKPVFQNKPKVQNLNMTTSIILESCGFIYGNVELEEFKKKAANDLRIERIKEVREQEK